MKFRSVTVAAAVVVGAMTTALGTAHADPVPDRQSIEYSTQSVDRTVVTRLTGGTFELVDKPGDARQFVGIRDSGGAVALEFPLDFRIAGVPIPVVPVLREGARVLEVTAEHPAGADLGALVAQAARPVASPVENGRALNDFTSRLGVAAAIGALIGGAVAGAIGCVIAVLMLCVPGAVVFGAVGAALGALVGGGPAVIRDGMELMATLQAPDGTTPWADRPEAAAGSVENPPS
ncbi:hypothetical protein [Nocardia wallacei]|uniref:hypothetical protein n=1 Tax=Nocardia wallacei TaxID=480035 RepID=UPI002456D327|nr:hypothetical protein [Nocardia wallacei]